MLAGHYSKSRFCFTYGDPVHETLFVRVIALHLSMVTLRLVTQMLV